MSLPSFTEGEAVVICAALLDWSAMDRIVPELASEDFWNPINRKIWEGMLGWYKGGRVVDYVTLFEAVKLSDIERQHFHTKILDATFSAANVMHYVEMMREKSFKRRLIKACDQAKGSCLNEHGGVEAAVEVLQQACLSKIRSHNGGLEHIGDIGRREMAALDERIQNGTELGLMTGIATLDSWTNGLFPGEFSVLCGRASHGKSALAEDVALHVSRRHPVHLFSLEMNKTSQWQRLVARLTGISLRQQRSRHITDNQAAVIADTQERLEPLSLWIEDLAGITPFDVFTRSSAIASRAGQPPALIIVDYLQIMNPSTKQTSREREVGSCATELKSYAKRMNCHIMALCQLNRQPDTRSGDSRAPMLSDLRDSGQIEQDADIVMGVWRRHAYTKAENDKNHAELLVLKQRNGPLGRIELWWEPEIASFRNKTRREG